MNAADLSFAGLARQAELVAAGEVGPRELVDAALERIERLDPQLNAFRVVFAERARAEARQAEARRGAGADASERPLLGVPVAVKDDMHVAGEVMAYGTGAVDAADEADSEIVRRLRRAGAIVIGKTHVPELTMWPFTESATWGVTRNPWDLGRTPGGSSGGSAAAVAAGLVPAATASDGLGSIRIPAACCGLFGLKPQKGRVPIAPKAADAWHGLVHYGTVTRSVRDSAVFLDAVADRPAGAEPYAAAAGRPPGRLRIAVSTKVPPPLIARLSAEQRGALDETAALLRSLGHQVVERDPAYEPAVLLRGLTRYFAGIADDAAKLPPERLERRTRAMARIGRATPRGQLAVSKAEERAFAERIGRLWDDVDVVLTPVLASLPWPVGAMEGRGALWTFNAAGAFVPWPGVWNITGQPAASVPAGFTPDGVPLAVQLVGRRDDEPTLLALAAQIEAERPWAQHRPPRFA